MGYSDESKGFGLMDPTTNQITVSRDVFDVVPTWDQKGKQIIEEPIYEDPLE